MPRHIVACLIVPEPPVSSLHFRSLPPVASLALTLLLGACADNSAPDTSGTGAPVATDSAGVRMLALGDVDRPFPDSLVEVLRIAPADSGLGMFSGVSAATVATNGTDRIYLLDQSESQVVVFDAAGTALDRWGRKGSGPGEFQYADRIVTNTDGSVEVFDFSRPAQLRFATDGTVLPMRRFPPDSAGSPMGVQAAWNDEVAFTRRRQADDSSTQELVLATPADTSVIASVTMSVAANVEFESCPIRLLGMKRYFSPGLEATGTGRGLVVQRSGAWRVEWYEGGALTEVWTRELPPRPTSDALLERELENGFRIRFNGNTCEVPTAEVIRLIGMAPTLPALRRVAVAPDGTVWAERFEPRLDPQRVDVVAPDGRYLGTLAGRGAPLGFLQGGRVLYRDTDEETGLMDLVVYRIPGATW
jgi:hypothetical protein